MLQQHNPAYPDTGVPIVEGWWKQPLAYFAHQVRKHCHECAVPLRGFGELSQGNGVEQTSETYKDVYLPKRDRPVQFVTEIKELQPGKIEKFNRYRENARL